MDESAWYAERQTAIHLLRSGKSPKEVAAELNGSSGIIHRKSQHLRNANHSLVPARCKHFGIETGFEHGLVEIEVLFCGGFLFMVGFYSITFIQGDAHGFLKGKHSGFLTCENPGTQSAKEDEEDDGFIFFLIHESYPVS